MRTTKFKLDARGLKNGQQGQERGLPLSFWALLSTFSKQVLRSEQSTPSMIKVDNEGKKGGGNNNNVVYSGQ